MSGETNPSAKVEQAGGKYDDAADKIPMQDRFQEKLVPKGQDPQPFKNQRKVGP